MFDSENYLARLTRLLKERFGPRLAYVGLQGSYLRNEAAEHSDIDIMVVVDGLSVRDLDTYRAVIASLEDPEKSCGFICSTADLANWNPLEICHLLHCTKDYYGTLSTLVPAWSRKDARNFVKLSINNLYHALCHRYLHASRERNEAALPYTYKSVFFILQNLHYLRTGTFLQTKALALELLSGHDKLVLQTAMEFDRDFDDAFALLFHWCQDTLASL